MKRYRTDTFGFTLIELVVVIAVMGTAVSLLAAVVTKTKIRDNITVCTNNLKRIGVALHAYADDYNGELPPMQYPRDNSSQDCHLWGTWDRGKGVHLGALLPKYISYKSGRETFYCPQVKNLKDDAHKPYHTPDEPVPYGPTADPPTGCSSYSYHDRLGYRPGVKSGSINIKDFSGSEPITADVVYFKWHGTGWNCLYMDGSVKYVKSDKVFEDDTRQHLAWIALGSKFHKEHPENP